MKRLMRTVHTEEDDNIMSVHLAMMASDVEEALILSGAKAGEDYTYKDLMGWAVALSANNIISLAIRDSTEKMLKEMY